MKVIIAAVILAVGILIGLYFQAEATRYDVVIIEAATLSDGTSFEANLMMIDHRTGKTWILNQRGSERGWYIIDDAAQEITRRVRDR